MLLKVSNFEASQEVPQPGRQDDKLRQVSYFHVLLAELKSFQLFCDKLIMVLALHSCQFPTMGFVVERFKSIQSFCSEPFWKIKVS